MLTRHEGLRPAGRGPAKIFRGRTAAVCLVWAVTLSACVFHQGYPPSWPARLGECDVAGIYADAGERWAESVPFPFKATVVSTRSLSGLLRGMGEYGKPFRVQLQPHDERTLDVHLHVDGDVGTPFSVPYGCTSDGMELAMPARWLRHGLSIVRVWGQLHLTKDAGGDLIGSLHYDTYGLIFIVPIVGGGNTWYRFRRAGHAPQSADAPPG